MIKALTIAGSDPSGGAGVQADLKVFRSLKVYGLSAITALTAQNTKGVSSVIPVEGRHIRRQLEVLLSDLVPSATKIGMLYSEASVRIVAEIVRAHSLKNIVVDPVFLSSTGKALAERGLPDLLKKKLFPLSTVITPNIHEASVLTGIAIVTKSDIEKAAARLRGYGPEAVIITGGHYASGAMDMVFAEKTVTITARKMPGEFHGTGCAFSAALAAYLARGYDVIDAARATKKFMRKPLHESFQGRGSLKLMNI